MGIEAIKNRTSILFYLNQNDFLSSNFSAIVSVPTDNLL
jgi:hypothetical protein